MRGSIYYQTSVLAKLVFKAGAKKLNRKDKKSDEYNLVASYNSMNSYRKVWNDLGFYIFENFAIKDFENLEMEHIKMFMAEKLMHNISHQYLQRISSAIGKLEFALNMFSKKHNRRYVYDFSYRKQIVKEAKKFELTSDNYRDRAYQNPEQIIYLLNDDNFRVAATIQLSGGARSEGVCLIKKEQLIGIKTDKITKKKYGYIETKEKGGKVGEVRIDIDTYTKLESVFEQAGVFKIDYRRYIDSIQNACRILSIKCEGTHGFRWNFAQNRMIEYQEAGYTHPESLQQVSYEMKHMRPDITSHYTG